MIPKELFIICAIIGILAYIKGQIRVKKQIWKNSQKVLICKHDYMTGEYKHKTEDQMIKELNQIKLDRNLNVSEWRFMVPSGFGPKNYKKLTGFETVSGGSDFYLEMK